MAIQTRVHDTAIQGDLGMYCTHAFTPLSHLYIKCSLLTMSGLCTDSLVVICLMHSHGHPGAPEEGAAVGGVLYGPTHVQGLGGPPVVQHIGLCCMAEPDCIHCLGEGQHAAPLQHQTSVNVMSANLALGRS